jgi:hypothetical protein
MFVLFALWDALLAVPRPPPAWPACQHCGHRPASRPRGLCAVCFNQPGVRELYQSTSRHGRRGPGNFNGTRTVPIPTDALPGTPAKVLVLTDRVANGEQLWHADDAARP